MRNPAPPPPHPPKKNHSSHNHLIQEYEFKIIVTHFDMIENKVLLFLYSFKFILIFITFSNFEPIYLIHQSPQNKLTNKMSGLDFQWINF